MRKAWIPVLLCLALALALAAGCGGNGETTVKTQPVEVEGDTGGVAGVYVEGGGGGTSGGGSISLLEDGKWEGNAWGSEKKGSYEVRPGQSGSDIIIMKFDDGASPEWWNATAAGGKVTAIVSPTGEQYTKSK
ncbi:MAG: hypothetical protein V1748_03115 [Actinomycetota bacterium]